MAEAAEPTREEFLAAAELDPESDQWVRAKPRLLPFE